MKLQVPTTQDSSGPANQWRFMVFFSDVKHAMMAPKIFTAIITEIQNSAWFCSFLEIVVFLEAAMVINLTAEPAVYICVGKNVLSTYMILVLAI